MTPDEIEDLAFNGAELPDSLGYAGTALFLMFRNLYDYAKRVKMPPAQGRREKQKILHEYERFLVLEKLGEHHRAVTMATQFSIAAFRKAPSIENAEALIEAIDGKSIREERWI